MEGTISSHTSAQHTVKCTPVSDEEWLAIKEGETFYDIKMWLIETGKLKERS